MLTSGNPLPGTEGMDLARALRRAKRLRLFPALEQVYADLPETKCPGCARCCFESPGLFFVEHLRLRDLLAKWPAARREELETAAFRELLFSWVEPERNCLFLDADRRCSIYAHRPLACRLFGLSAPADPEQAQEELRLAAAEEAEQLRLLGLTVPAATLGRALASCDRVRTLRGRRPRVDPDAFAERVAELDARLLPEEVVRQEYCFLSLPDRLGAAALGGEVVETLRLQVLRRAQRGASVEALVTQVQGRK
jgi:Fe-S-cluster containining protein